MSLTGCHLTCYQKVTEVTKVTLLNVDRIVNKSDFDGKVQKFTNLIKLARRANPE